MRSQYHPDGRSQDEADAARFIEIQRACAILSDPVTRDAYDHEQRQTLVDSAPMSETGAGLASQSLGADPAADPEIQRIPSGAMITGWRQS